MDGTEGRVSVGMDREYSRRNFLKTAGAVGAAISAMGIGGFGVAVRTAQGQAQPYTTYEGLGDAAILQFAYQLELLEGNFYAIGADSGLFRSTFLDQIAIISEHEFAHAEAIATTLGDLGEEVPPEPDFTFPTTPPRTRRPSWVTPRRWSRSGSGLTRERRPSSRARTSWPRRSRSTTPSASTGARSTS